MRLPLPVSRVTQSGRPGYRWGESGTFYGYTPGNEASRARAEARAIRQGQAARAAGYEEPTFTPPASVAAAARRGLALREAQPPSNKAGTAVGIARARDLANRRPLSVTTLRRMASYFARHEVDKEGEGWGIDSKGYQAWLLWGGDPGRAWVNRQLSNL